jgi:hypothetical protein
VAYINFWAYIPYKGKIGNTLGRSIIAARSVCAAHAALQLDYVANIVAAVLGFILLSFLRPYFYPRRG